MALTTNYSWDKPTVGGDSGAWGTKLNTIFDSIDTQVKNRQNEAAAAQTDASFVKAALLELANRRRAWAAESEVTGNQSNNGVTDFVRNADTGEGPGTTSGTRTYILPLTDLVAGMRISSFSTRGHTDATITGVIALKYVVDEVVTTVSAGHTPAAGAYNVVSTAGINHDVVAGRMYYLEYTASQDSGILGTDISYSKLTVIYFP